MQNYILERKSTVEDAIEYARHVINGQVVAGKYIKKQCQAFIDDLETNQFEDDFRWEFSRQRAEHVLTYCQLLNFVEGPQARTSIILQPWQAFLLVNLFGWLSKSDHYTLPGKAKQFVVDGVRRYNRALVLVARKAGKSTLLGALALYELQFAPEGSQIVTMATQREQAKLVWQMSGRMQAVSDPRLTKGFKKTQSVITNENSWNRYTPLSKQSERLDGLNIRMAIADESAAITDDNLFNVVTSSMGNQSSPLIVHITTGQPGAESGFFYGELDYAKKVLDGVIEDDRILCLAYQIDEGDDWQDIENVIKAQPNLEVSVPLQFFREELEQAKSIPRKASNYRTKYLNEFISSVGSWIEVASWNKNIGSIDRSLPCYIGLDLGATDDLCAVSLIFGPDAQGNFYFDATCFVPEITFQNVPKHVLPIYLEARKNGKLVVTEGEVRDDTVIREHIRKLSSEVEVREICYDDWSALTLVNQLQEDGYELVNIQQNMKALSPITKEVEIWIKNGRIVHGGDNFLSWQLSNCQVYTDANENIKVRKGNDRALKVDAIIAMLMAMARASLNKAKPTFNWYMSD